LVVTVPNAYISPIIVGFAIMGLGIWRLLKNYEKLPLGYGSKC
jgi:hypothetical protein